MIEERPQVFEFDEFRLDTMKRQLTRTGEVVPLYSKAFDLLQVMVSNSGRDLTKDELLDRVWPGQILEESNLSVNMSAVRRALGEKAAEPRYIVTVPGRGYRFVAAVRVTGNELSGVVVATQTISQITIEEETGNQACIDVKRVNVSAAFVISIEFQETGFLVHRIYKASYGNLPGAPVPVKFNEFMPDAQEIANGVVVNQPGWQQALENNKQAFVSEFVQRSRFTQAYPTSLSPTQFVNALFANAGVTSSPAERAAAMNEFGTAADTSDPNARARALRDVAENPTLIQQEFNRAFVLMQYFGYLRRDPNAAPEPSLDYQGYNFWLSKLNQFNGSYVDAEMVKAFINSGEYRQRFGQ